MRGSLTMLLVIKAIRQAEAWQEQTAKHGKSRPMAGFCLTYSSTDYLLRREPRRDELPVQTGDVGDGNAFGAFRFAGAANSAVVLDDLESHGLLLLSPASKPASLVVLIRLLLHPAIPPRW